MSLLKLGVTEGKLQFMLQFDSLSIALSSWLLGKGNINHPGKGSSKHEGGGKWRTLLRAGKEGSPDGRVIVKYARSPEVSSQHHIKLGMVVHACNPGMQRGQKGKTSSDT